MTPPRARRPPRGCKQDGAGSTCPICQMKFPSPVHFHSDHHEKIVLKHMMDCSANATQKASPKQVTPLLAKSKQGKAGDLSSPPLRSISLSLSVPEATASTGNSDDSTEDFIKMVRKINSSTKVKCPICSKVMYRSSSSHRGQDFDQKVMRHVLKCSARTNVEHGADSCRGGPRQEKQGTTPPVPNKKGKPTKLTTNPRTTKRWMDGNSQLGRKSPGSVTAGSVQPTPQATSSKQKVAKRTTHRDPNNNLQQTPLKNEAGYTPPGKQLPKRKSQKIDDHVYSNTDSSNTEGGCSLISDSSPSETASWISDSRPKKVKIKPNAISCQKKETLQFESSEDPNHFLNQTWWRTTRKRREKHHLVPFDYQQCIVTSITNPSDSRAKIANSDDKDSRQVVRGSKRLKIQANEQLKLCCPICHKEFKATQAIFLTEEVMSRHVSKCSEKVFTLPDHAVSISNQVDDVSHQKPIRMSSKEKEDRASSHAARAQSNYFLMHGKGEQAFMDLLFENSK